MSQKDNTRRQLEQAQRQLQKVSQQVSPEYRQLIRAEMQTDVITTIAPHIPGLLRPLGFVRDNLEELGHTHERRNHLVQTLRLRQQVTALRQQAGELSMRAIIGTNFFDTLGVHCPEQTRRIQMAHTLGTWTIHMVPDYLISPILDEEQPNGQPIHAVVLFHNREPLHGVAPRGTYTEYHHAAAGQPHESWDMNPATFSHYTEVFTRLSTVALMPEQMLHLLEAQSHSPNAAPKTSHTRLQLY